jgi:hypothetical protein
MTLSRDSDQFPWIIWEHSGSYRSVAATFQAELDEVVARLERRGYRRRDMRIEARRDGFLVWPGYGVPYQGWPLRHPHSLDAARNLALTLGLGNWLTLDELWEYADEPETSRIFEVAMWQLGFRRSRRTQGQWARRQASDKAPRLADRWALPDGVNHSRDYFDHHFRPLLVQDNAPPNLGTSYTIQASGGLCSSMLYISIDANPFFSGSAEQAGSYLARQFGDHCHLATGQPGFFITGQNLQVGSGERAPKYVIVSVQPQDGPAITEVWPSRVANRIEGANLLSDFIERRQLQALTPSV